MGRLCGSVDEGSGVGPLLEGFDYFEIDIVIDDKFENDDGEYPDYYKAVFKKYKVKLEYIGGLSTEWMHKASGKKSELIARLKE